MALSVVENAPSEANSVLIRKPPDAKALNVAYSWLAGWGLDVALPEGPCQADLVCEGKTLFICCRDGKRCGQTKCTGPCGDVTLSPANLNSRDVTETLHEMWKATLVLGVGTPAGFRKPTGSLRARSDDYEATSMRLTPFERTANPPEWLLKRYVPTVKREADLAARRYEDILRMEQMNRGDLWSIGMMYLCVYLHRHQDLHNEKKNGANLTLYLRQEFKRWANVTCEHLKNIYFSGAGVPLGEVVGAPVEGVDFREAGPEVEASYTFEPGERDPEPPEPEFASEADRLRYERRLAIEDGKMRAARRRARCAELEDRFSMMSHDQYVQVLSEVINGERHPVDAREAAQARMDRHCQECEPCRTAARAWTDKEHEERRMRALNRSRKRGQAEEYIPTIDDLEPTTPTEQA